MLAVCQGKIHLHLLDRRQKLISQGARMKIITAHGKTPIYDRYKNSNEPFDGAIEIDLEKGSLYACFVVESTGVVELREIILKRAYQFRITPLLSAGAINSLLNQILPLAIRVERGYKTVWDGHNTVGELDRDATDAIYEIRDICAEIEPDIDVWTAEEWIENSEPEIMRRLAAGESIKIIADDFSADDRIIVHGDREAIHCRIEEIAEDARAEAEAEVEAEAEAAEA